MSKRPQEIYELLGKVQDGTFLNEQEYTKLEKYISMLEASCQSSGA